MANGNTPYLVYLKDFSGGLAFRSEFLVKVDSFVGLSQVVYLFYYLFCERLFLENCMAALIF